MKNYLICILLCFSALNALAVTTDQEKQLIKLMTSGELRELKVAAQQMFQVQTTNPEVMDVAAEILLRKYENAYSDEVDTLAWLTKSIGATKNGRYHEVLTKVATSGSSNKLQSYAKKALKDIKTASDEQYVLGSTKLPNGIYPIKSAVELDQELITKISSGSLVELKNAVKQVVSSKNQSQAVGDMAAEVLLNLYSHGFEYQQDTLAWVCKALGANRSGRYREVLNEVATKASGKALVKYAKTALKEHGAAKGEQYQKGMSKLTKKEYM